MAMRLPPIECSDGTYSLYEQYQGKTALRGHDVSSADSKLMPSGAMILKRGFIWDGPSGPAIDTPRTLMPSALHDALYRMIEQGLLPRECRLPADQTYREALRTWGVPKWRRLLHFKGVRHFGGLWMWLK